MFQLSIHFVAVDEKGNQYVIARTDYPQQVEPGPLWDVVRRMSHKPSVGFNLGSPVTMWMDRDPECWKRTENRKGQIAYADARRRMRQEGVRLHSNNLRSEIGKRVEDLNKLDPTLNLTFEEALEYARELVQEAVNQTFKTDSKNPVHEGDSDPMRDPSHGHNHYHK